MKVKSYKILTLVKTTNIHNTHILYCMRHNRLWLAAVILGDKVQLLTLGSPRSPVAEPFCPLGLVVDVLDLVHRIRPIDGYRDLFLDVHRVRFVNRIRHRFLYRVRDRFDDGHRVRHADGYRHRLRYADRHRPVHRNGYGPVDLHVLRDHRFGSVRWCVAGTVSGK